MIRYVSLRILLTLPALWLIVTLVFLLAHIIPGDPVQQMLGEGARTEDLQQLRHTLGLDRPVPAQYAHYLVGLFHGDLGQSFRFQEPVARVVFSHYQRRLSWRFAGCSFASRLAFPLVCSPPRAAARRRTTPSACSRSSAFRCRISLLARC
jgi:ABC-type dipeptide/oligopeptide/nickel transport system permease component